MDDARPQKELEMRVAGADNPGCAGAIEAAVRAIDPDAHIRVDPATGIVHAFTSCDTLEVADAIARAGFEPSAMTL
jgi:copper chaperone CopZ